MQKTKFAIIGCGKISKKHLDALTKHTRNTEVVAVSDTNPTRAQAVGAEYKVPFYTDPHEMLKKHSDIQVLDVLVPSGAHAAVVSELAPYRKHFIVEKPIALKMEDAEEMIRACHEYQSRLFVVKQNRFNVPVEKLREAVSEGRFGKMVMGTVRVRWCRDQKYYDQDPWRGTWEHDGGVLANQASHHIDLLTYLMGDVDSVFAYTATRLVNIETEDTAAAVLKFANGALGIVEATTATRPKDLEGSISILGEHGAVEIGGFAMNELRTWQFADKRPEDEEVLTKFKSNPPGDPGYAHVKYLENVAELVRSGAPGGVDGLEGFKSLILVNAFYESMEIGQEVRLRFRPRMAKLGRNIRILKRAVGE